MSIAQSRRVAPIIGLSRGLHLLLLLSRLAVGSLLLGAILVLLAGVLLRYIVADLTARFDLPAVSFFWVEEVGELMLAWLVFVGAAIGVQAQSHFALNFLTRHFSVHVQHALARVNAILIFCFGMLMAYESWRLTTLNADLKTPALSISLGCLYFAGVVGCTLIAVFALSEVLATKPKLPTVENAPE